MKELKNPSDDYKEAYDALKEFYDAYLELTNLAIEPSGNLGSYTETYNEADQEVAKCYKEVKMYLD